MSINDTVTRTLQNEGRGQYTSYATGVVRALEEREYAASESLIREAVARGLSRDEAQRLVTRAGLSVRPAPVQTRAAASGEEGTNRTLDSVARVLDGLVGFARQHGYRG